MRSAGLHPCEQKPNTELVCVRHEESCYLHQLAECKSEAIFLQSNCYTFITVQDTLLDTKKWGRDELKRDATQRKQIYQLVQLITSILQVVVLIEKQCMVDKHGMGHGANFNLRSCKTAIYAQRPGNHKTAKFIPRIVAFPWVQSTTPHRA